MYTKIKDHLEQELASIKANGLYKEERIITSPQGAEITLNTGDTVLNFCANNYLGLSSHPEVIQAAKDTMDTHGFGIVGLKIFIKNWSARLLSSTEQKIPFYMQLLLMLTVVYLNLY